MEDTRDLAVRALAQIGEHTKSCDKRQDQLMTCILKIDEKLDGLSSSIAEARGASKLVKWVAGILVAGGGMAGGAIQHVIFR
jgi:hypothetical protein